MPSISISPLPYFRMELSVDDDLTYEILKGELTVVETVTFRRWSKKFHRMVLDTKERPLKIFDDLPDKNGCKRLSIRRGLLQILFKRIMQIPSVKLTVDPKLFANFKLPLLDKWKSIFDAHPREQFKGWQEIDYHLLTKYPCATVELCTGYGKSELLLSVLEAILNSDEEGNIILIAPDNGVKEELFLRAKKYGIEIGKNNWNNRINVINPVGYKVSNASESQEAIDWMKKVRFMLSDEAHHWSAASYQWLLDEQLENLELSYGFTASLDVAEGDLIDPSQVNSLSDLTPRIIDLTSVLGPVVQRRSLPIPVELYEVNCAISDKTQSKILQDDGTERSWIEVLDHFITRFETGNMIGDLMISNPGRVFFMPIHKKESSMELYKHLIEVKGLGGVIWTTSGLVVNGNKISTDEPLAYLKELMKNDSSIRFMMSTRYEGIDLPGLNAVIPLTGTSYRLTVQPIGRSARFQDVQIYLLYDRNCPLVRRQSDHRKDIILRTYKIVAHKKIKWN